MLKKTEIAELMRRMDAEYGTNIRCFLNHENAWQLLVATILSAQCTDACVNTVTPGLFEKYKSPGAFANADIEELSRDIRSTGFFRNKAKNIIGAMKIIDEKYHGEMPSDIEELTALPGVGRKTANVIRTTVHDIPSIVVDTHVKRLSKLMGLTKNDDPEKIEFDLMKKIPKDHWSQLNLQFVSHGRKVCRAGRPDCKACVLKDVCEHGRKTLALFTEGC